MLNVLSTISKIKLLAILCIVLCLQSGYSQLNGFNYIEPDLRDINPEWVYMSYEEDIVNVVTDDDTIYVYDGYNHIISLNDKSPQPLIHDGYLYKVSSTLYNNDLAGIMIEKIDIDTGELMWQKGYDPLDADHDFCEHIIKAEIEDNSLRMYNLRLLPFSGSSIFGFVWGQLMQRSFDLDSGEQIDFQPADTTLQNAVIIKSREAHDLEFIAHSDKDLIEIFNVTGESSEREKVLLIDSINNLGQKLNPHDTIESVIRENLDLSDYRTSKWLKLIKDNDVLYWLQFYRAVDNTSQISYSDILKIKGNEVDTIHLTDIGDIQNIEKIQFETHGDSTLVLFLQTYDNQGEFVEISKEDGSQISRSYFSKCAYQHLNRDYNDFDNYKRDDFIIAGNCNMSDTIKSIVYEREGSVLVPRKEVILKNLQYNMSVHELVKIDESDYLLFFFYREIGANLIPIGRFSGVMRVSGQELGLVPTNALDAVVSHSGFGVYPNPCQDVLTLSFPKNKIYNIRIIDGLGRILYAGKSLGEPKYKVDVKYLPVGHYSIMVNCHDYSMTKPLIILR